MESKWYYKIVILEKDNIREFILCVDLNEISEDIFIYWGENQKEILKLINKTNSVYENSKIHSCREVNYEFVGFNS